MSNILTPMLALILWTFVLWFLLYATRLPAIKKAGIDARRLKRKEDLDVLPLAARQIADNYNHLHEQPTVFYALVVYTHLVGAGDGANVTLAWAYVGLRVAHSLVQCTFNFVPLRFVIFVSGSLVLMAIAVRDLLRLLA